MAQYEVQIFRNGTSTAPGPEVYFLSDWDKEYVLYTYLYVVRGEGHTMLIDTGVDDIGPFNEMLLREFGGKITFDLPEDETIEAIIEKAQIDPEEVDTVFVSHLHVDHSSNVSRFPNAKVVLSRKGWLTYMKKDRPYYYDDVLFPTGPIKYIAGLPPERVLLVDEEEEVLPGITAFWVGGHTPGTMAVEVDTAKGKVVFSSDVAVFIDNVTQSRPIGLFYSLWECYEAYSKINARADVIISGHDPRVLDELFPDGRI
jgi:glyoxylase-like metal-dependent hydrolase (beta-lactamase superfamily II)